MVRLRCSTAKTYITRRRCTVEESFTRVVQVQHDCTSHRLLVPGFSSYSRLTGAVYAMEKSVVQLDIPREWNLWRIYQFRASEQDGREDGHLDVYYHMVELVSGYKEWFISCPDPMDEDGFDDATSFPALKPDLDIFGPPGRCRKQRGWYHVRRWPPVAHMTEKYATGADIPPEVIDMIAVRCNTYEFNKKDLGMLRLVCRRWQDHLVGRHIHSISAASSQRIRELSALQTKRLALGWKAYPIDFSKFELKLNQPSKMESWVEAVKRLGLNKDAAHTLSIEGPVAPGQRFTSVHLSSPCRAPWNPVCINRLILMGVHFKKPSDLVRPLRELPFLVHVKGEKVTWDASSEEFPRVTSFIPAKLPQDRFPRYRFTNSQRGIAGILHSALTPAGHGPMLQSDAEALYRLSADLDVSFSAPGQFDKDPMHMEWKLDSKSLSPIVDIWLERMHTRPQVRVVKCLTFFTLCDDRIQRILSMPWEAIAAHIENLSSQPTALFLFHSTASATLFSEHFATVPKMASLRTRNRLIYALEDKDKGVSSVVKEGEDGEWITLAHANYDLFDSNSRCPVLDELAMRNNSH